jgi:hypothetical protein
MYACIMNIYMYICMIVYIYTNFKIWMGKMGRYIHRIFMYIIL